VATQAVRSAHTFHGVSTPDPRGDRYKWIALSNTTLGVLLATLDASITLIAMPDIFRGHPTGWSSPRVIALLSSGAVLSPSC